MMVGNERGRVMYKRISFKYRERYITCKTLPLTYVALQLRISFTDSKVESGLFSIINSTTGKYCSIAFI